MKTALNLTLMHIIIHTLLLSFIFIRFCSFCALFEIKLSIFSAKNDFQFEWITIASIWNAFTIQSQNHCFISSNLSVEYPIFNLITVHSQGTECIHLYFYSLGPFENVFCASVEQCFPCLFGLKHYINLPMKILKFVHLLNHNHHICAKR